MAWIVLVIGMGRRDNSVTALGRALPGLGYALSLAICAALEKLLMARWGRTGRELAWFVLAPALFGITHLLTRRAVQASRGYGALAIGWLSAAGIGLLAHWQWLGAAAPLLSLVRYLLIALAGCLFCLSVIVQRPLFATRDASGPMIGRLLAALVGAAMLAAWLGVIAIVIYFTPFPVALASPEPGLKYERVWTSDWENYLVWLAWSPDSRSILGQAESIWLVLLQPRSASPVAAPGMISPDRPWSADGEGFFYTRRGARHPGVWFASVKAKAARSLVEGPVGVPSCSPDGATIAFDSGKGLVVLVLRSEVDSLLRRVAAGAEGSDLKVVAESGEVPRWAPDGRHLLVTRTTPAGSSYWVVSLDGHSWPVDVPVVGLDEVAWVSGESFATIVVKEGPRIPFVGVRRTAIVTIWELRGRRVKEYLLGSYLGDGGCSLAARQDGRCLAIATDMMAPFSDSLVMLDLHTGQLRRLPASPYGAGGLAWSPDGRSLALSDAQETAHEQHYSYLAIISGLKLFDKEKPW